MNNKKIIVKKSSKKDSIEHFLVVPDVDPMIISLVSKIDFSKLLEQEKNELKKQMHLCKHKLQAMAYHKNRISVLEKNYKKVLKSSIRQIRDKESIIVTEVPDIAFEFESFLFQTKAFLDIYSRLVGKHFKHTPSSIKKLKKILVNNKDVKSRILLKLLSKRWINYFISKDKFNISMRDIVAHYSKLNISPFGIIVINQKKRDTLLTTVGDKRIRDLISSIFKNSKKLLKKSILILLLE